MFMLNKISESESESESHDKKKECHVLQTLCMRYVFFMNSKRCNALV